MAALNSRDYYLKTGINPRLISQTYTPADLSIKLQGTSIIVNLVFSKELPVYIKNFDIKLWRQGEGFTGTYASDWWNDQIDTNNLITISTTNIAEFNLMSLSNTPVKRISQTGINYQIAARSKDTGDNTSFISIQGSILIKTIS